MDVQTIMTTYCAAHRIKAGDLPYYRGPYKDIPAFPEDWQIELYDVQDDVGDSYIVVRIAMDGQATLAMITGEVYAKWANYNGETCRDAYYGNEWVEVKTVQVTTTSYQPK